MPKAQGHGQSGRIRDEIDKLSIMPRPTAVEENVERQRVPEGEYIDLYATGTMPLQGAYCPSVFHENSH